MIICDECGTELNEDTNFCHKCGFPIKNKNVINNEKTKKSFIQHTSVQVLIAIPLAIMIILFFAAMNSIPATNGIAITSDGVKVTHEDDFEIIREETIGSRNEDGIYTITGKLKQNIEGSYTGIMPTFNLLDINGKKVRTTSGLMITNYEGDNIWTFTVNGNDADGVVVDYELFSCYGY